MDGDEAAQQAAGRRPLYWCRICKEPVWLAGAALPPEFRTAVHDATGMEAAQDNHMARPTDENPLLRAQADELEADFPEFRITVRFGIPRATLRKGEFALAPGAMFVPLQAPTITELRARMRAVRAEFRLAHRASPEGAPAVTR